MSRSQCNECGAVAEDIDAGFSPGRQAMKHAGCGGSWREVLDATIHERGNGLPDRGDYVPGDDGELYRVVWFTGPIHTAAAGAPNYIHAHVELAQWDDVEESDVFPAACVLGDDETAPG